TMSFHHKTLASHPNEESCSHHKNLIRIKNPGFTSKSLCIRVNNTPVHFSAVKGKKNEFIIGPIAGPNAKITARYCVGKMKCSEDCTIPKDEFMDAIGGGSAQEGEKQNVALGQWE